MRPINCGSHPNHSQIHIHHPTVVFVSHRPIALVMYSSCLSNFLWQQLNLSTLIRSIYVSTTKLVNFVLRKFIEICLIARYFSSVTDRVLVHPAQQRVCLIFIREVPETTSAVHSGFSGKAIVYSGWYQSTIRYQSIVQIHQHRTHVSGLGVNSLTANRKWFSRPAIQIDIRQMRAASGQWAPRTIRCQCVSYFVTFIQIRAMCYSWSTSTTECSIHSSLVAYRKCICKLQWIADLWWAICYLYSRRWLCPVAFSCPIAEASDSRILPGCHCLFGYYRVYRKFAYFP